MEKTPVNRLLSNLKNHTYPNRIWRAQQSQRAAEGQPSQPENAALPSLQVNWRVRYCKLLNQNRDLFDEAKSILEVGSGNIGIAPYVQRKVTGLELAFNGPVDQWLEPVAGSIFKIPFGGRSFDNVICVDVLEHLPEAARPQAIAELIRCARRKVIISCPCGPAAEEGERHLADLFRRTQGSLPGWLSEHLEIGLPSVGSLFGTLLKTGLPFEITGNESMNQHFAGVLLDSFFPFSQQLNDRQASKTPFAAPVGEAEWDSYYSYMFTIHADEEYRPKARPGFSCRGLSSEARLYCVYHKPWPTGHLGPIIPVFAGPAAASAPENGLTDCFQNAACLDNGRWSELSAFYKIWKEGPRSEIVGFSHYRRIFNFGAVGSKRRETVLLREDLTRHVDDYFDQKIIEKARNNAIIVPPPVKLGETVWEHYASHHNINDYCRVLNIISRKDPELLPFAGDHFKSHRLYANNMFVTSWPIFDELCTRLFCILEEFEKSVPASRANTYQNRDISFLAERVFDLWVRHKQSTGTKIIECPIFFIQ